jgi:hypothetical protein
MFTSAPRCSPRATMRARVDHGDSSTCTSSTEAVPPASRVASKALRRPMITPGSRT